VTGCLQKLPGLHCVYGLGIGTWWSAHKGIISGRKSAHICGAAVGGAFSFLPSYHFGVFLGVQENQFLCIFGSWRPFEAITVTAQ
jgi:hypothetical protein